MLGVCLVMAVCDGKFSPALMRETLECILCKYVPAVARGMRAVHAVRRLMPFAVLDSQAHLKQHKQRVLFKVRDSFGSLCTQQELTYLSNK